MCSVNPGCSFLLGTRFDESTARKATMDAHTRMDSTFTLTGPSQRRAPFGPSKTGRPMTWSYLLKLDWANGMPNPFADINQDLSMLYRMRLVESARSSMTRPSKPVRAAGSGVDMHRRGRRQIANQMIATEKDITTSPNWPPACFPRPSSRRAKPSKTEFTGATDVARHAGQGDG